MGNVTVDQIVVDGLVGHLTEKMKTPFLDDDWTRVNLIRSGRLQDSPERAMTNLLIHDGSNSDMWDGLYQNQVIGVTAPTFHVGGGATYIHTYVIETEFHYKGVSDRREARDYAHITYQRLRLALAQAPIFTHPDTGQPQDDFNETIFYGPIVGKSSLREGGGGNQFIWRGELHVHFLTELLPEI